MDKLPPEIQYCIFDYLPTSDYQHIRLVCQTFNGLVAKRTFGVLASFINPNFALATLHTIAQDIRRRPNSIWSPNCAVPVNLHIPEDFLMALWVGISGRSFRHSKDGRKTSLTTRVLQRRFKERNITQEAVKQALFRYALYLSYCVKDGVESPHTWVVTALQGSR